MAYSHRKRRIVILLVTGLVLVIGIAFTWNYDQLETSYYIHKLESSDPTEKQTAADVLVEKGPDIGRSFEDAVRYQLEFGQGEGRIKTLEKLKTQPSVSVPILIDCLAKESLAYHAKSVLVQINPPPFKELIAALDRAKPTTIKNACYTLSEMNGPFPGVLPKLLELSNGSNDREVGVAINRALKRFTKVPAVEDIPSLMQHLDDRVSYLYVVGALRRLGQPGIQALKTALKSNFPPAVQAAARALHDLNAPTEDLIEPLIEAMMKGHHSVSLNLSQIGKPAVSKLIPLLDHKNQFIRAIAARTLGNIKEDAVKAIPGLINLLGDKQSIRPRYQGTVGSMASSALVKIGKLAVPDLVKALGHENPQVRLNAVIALYQLAMPEDGVVEGLSQRLTDKATSLIRFHSAAALRKIGPPARSSVPALNKALNDEDEAVRGMAASALKRIGGYPPELEETLRTKYKEWADKDLEEAGK